MFKFDELKQTKEFSKKEFRVTLFCIIGVLFMGVYQGIIIALILSIIQLIERSSKPIEHELVYESDTEITSEINDSNKNLIRDDVMIYRFNSALVFFNSDFFRTQITKRASSKTNLKSIIIDARPINYIDLTSLKTLTDVIKDFSADNIKVYFAAAEEQLQIKISKELKENNLDDDIFLPNIRSFFVQ
jgi:SulP family sulfate permease